MLQSHTAQSAPGPAQLMTYRGSRNTTKRDPATLPHHSQQLRGYSPAIRATLPNYPLPRQGRQKRLARVQGHSSHARWDQGWQGSGRHRHLRPAGSTPGLLSSPQPLLPCSKGRSTGRSTPSSGMAAGKGPPATSSILSTGTTLCTKAAKASHLRFPPQERAVRTKKNNCLEKHETRKQHVLQGLL